jgi:hypothetical protein
MSFLLLPSWSAGFRRQTPTYAVYLIIYLLFSADVSACQRPSADKQLKRKQARRPHLKEAQREKERSDKKYPNGEIYQH